jgi:hypothetical protein
MEHDADAAPRVGDMRENATAWRNRQLGMEIDPPDVFRDLWNNQLGREIGAYAVEHGLANDDVAKLIFEAIDGEKAIFRIRELNPETPRPYSKECRLQRRSRRL